MTVEEGKSRLTEIQFRRLRDIPMVLSSGLIPSDKGYAGKILEELIGLSPKRGNDFVDGELKTCNFTKAALPKENVYVTQVRPIIDDLLCAQPFEESSLFEKIKNVLIVPVYRPTKSPFDWMYFHPLQLSYHDCSQRDIYNAIKADYNSICSHLSVIVDNARYLEKTFNGKYLQLRNKDYRPYKAIFSEYHQAHISDRDFAFWLQKALLVELKRRQGHGVKWTTQYNDID